MARYQDKKVVILGGTSGMGLATAKKLSTSFWEKKGCARNWSCWI